MKRIYVDKYALYHAVEVELNNGDKFKGWLVPKDRQYSLLPLDDIWHIYSFNASFIKEITHLTNGVQINKLAKEIDATETGFIEPKNRKIFG